MSRRKFDSIMLSTRTPLSLTTRRLTDGEFRAFIGMLCMAGDSPVRGSLLVADGVPASVSEIADFAKCRVSAVRSAIEKLVAMGTLAGSPEAHWRFTAWSEQQPAPQSDSTNAARQRKYRASKHGPKRESNGVTNAPVTVPRNARVTGGREEKRREEQQGANALAVIAGGHTVIDEAVSILSSVWPNLDPVGIENCAAMDSDADLIAAARLAVVWGSSPTWKLPPAASLAAAMRNLKAKQSGGRSKAERDQAGVDALKRLGAEL